MRGALGPDRQLYSGAFPLGGDVYSLHVGTSWIELDPAGVDLVALYVPAGTGQVILRSSESDLDGAAVESEDVETSFPLAPGYFEFCTDRAGDSPRFWLGLDPNSEGGVAVVRVMRAAV